jgi:hypothetical protein
MAKQTCPQCHAVYDDHSHEIESGGDVAGAVSDLRELCQGLAKDVREIKEGRHEGPPAPEPTPEPGAGAPENPPAGETPARSRLVVHA